LKVSVEKRTGFSLTKNKIKVLIFNKLILKYIWKFIFFDFIFAPENEKKISILKMKLMTTQIKNSNKMNVLSSHKKNIIVPEFDFGLQHKQVQTHIR